MAKTYQWTNNTRLGFINDELDGLWERITLPAAASVAADGDLAASEVSFSLDEVGHNLHIKVKYSDGSTVKTGTVALT